MAGDWIKFQCSTPDNSDGSYCAPLFDAEAEWHQAQYQAAKTAPELEKAYRDILNFCEERKQRARDWFDITSLDFAIRRHFLKTGEKFTSEDLMAASQPSDNPKCQTNC